MVSPSCWGRPHSDIKHKKKVHGVTIVLWKALRWQKAPEYGSWCHHRAAGYLAVTQKSRKWFIVSQSCCRRHWGDKRYQRMVHGITIILRNTSRWHKRPENGLWRHHRTVEGLVVTQNTRNLTMVSPLCCGRSRGDRKDQKMVHGVDIMLTETSRWQKRPENGPWCHHNAAEYLAVAQKTRIWSIV